MLNSGVFDNNINILGGYNQGGGGYGGDNNASQDYYGQQQQQPSGYYQVEKIESYIASYYRQLSTDSKMKNLVTSINLMIFHFDIRRKLSVIRCYI